MPPGEPVGRPAAATRWRRSWRRHERRLPIVTVHDAASHALAWLGSVFGARVVPVGVDDFGQSGSIVDLYRHFDLLPSSWSTPRSSPLE